MMTFSRPLQDSPEDVANFLRIQIATGWGKTLVQFADWCDPCPGWRILDVGCGPGLLPAIFQERGCQAFGVDIDPRSFAEGRLHTALALADAARLPFAGESFQMVTASNLLFLLAEPLPILREIVRLLSPDGKVCVLNPSEHLTVSAATELARQRGLNGLARASLINWAALAESRQHWNESLTKSWFAAAGLVVIANDLKIGPGFARFASGIQRAVQTA